MLREVIAAAFQVALPFMVLITAVFVYTAIKRASDPETKKTVRRNKHELNKKKKEEIYGNARGKKHGRKTRKVSQ